MKFGTWNFRRLYRPGSLTTAASELAKCNLDPVAVQEVRWVEGGSQRADNYTFFFRNVNANRHLGTGFFIRKEIRSTIERIEIYSNTISYITLTGH
jgi:exonuclease III